MSRRQVLILLSASAAFIFLCATIADSARAQNDPPPAPVRLVIDYGQGVEKHFNRIQWREGLTVLGAMQQAGELPTPLKLGFDVKGRGEMAFVHAIDGLASEGGGKGRRNWLFKVNGRAATRSCGVVELHRGDLVRWTFESYNSGREP